MNGYCVTLSLLIWSFCAPAIGHALCLLLCFAAGAVLLDGSYGRAAAAVHFGRAALPSLGQAIYRQDEPTTVRDISGPSVILSWPALLERRVFAPRTCIRHFNVWLSRRYPVAGHIAIVTSGHGR